MLTHRPLTRRRQRPPGRPQMHGVMLLEVLIALLIFALGVLGLVGLQANAVKQSGQAKYRADATLLANELIGQMWLTSRSFTPLQTAFTSDSGGGPQYKTWLDKVQSELPGADTKPPTVTFKEIKPLDVVIADKPASAAASITSSTQVTITMYWKAPGEPSTDPAHNIVLVNEIR